MRLHPTRTNLAPSALGRQPSTCALDSSRSLPFIAPLRPRWSPVVFQRKMPSISFPILLLRDSFFHDDRGTPTPLHLFPILSLACPERSRGVTRYSFTPSAFTEGPLSLSFATHPKNAPITLFLATHPKTQALKVLCLPHIRENGGFPPPRFCYHPAAHPAEAP